MPLKGDALTIFLFFASCGVAAALAALALNGRRLVWALVFTLLCALGAVIFILRVQLSEIRLSSILPALPLPVGVGLVALMVKQPRQSGSAGPLERDIEIKRDATVKAAACWYAFGDETRSAYALDNAETAALRVGFKELRQAAFDGRLYVWGRQSAEGVYVRFDEEYWIDHSFDVDSALAGRAVHALPAQGLMSYPTCFDAMVSMAQVKALWPRTSKSPVAPSRGA